MAEWSMAVVLKTTVIRTRPRISRHSPPVVHLARMCGVTLGFDRGETERAIAGGGMRGMPLNVCGSESRTGPDQAVTSCSVAAASGGAVGDAGGCGTGRAVDDQAGRTGPGGSRAARA